MGLRVSTQPIELPKEVKLDINGQHISANGKLGQLDYVVHPLVNVVLEDNVILVKRAEESKAASAQAGTARSNIANLVEGVHKGFQKDLEIQGVGFKAAVKKQGSKSVLEMQLGFAHLVTYVIPEGITIETPSATEVAVKGSNKQLVGQVAANIRAFRPPEPYKGKGIRLKGEVIIQKETKKK